MQLLTHLQPAGPDWQRQQRRPAATGEGEQRVPAGEPCRLGCGGCAAQRSACFQIQRSSALEEVVATVRLRKQGRQPLLGRGRGSQAPWAFEGGSGDAEGGGGGCSCRLRFPELCKGAGDRPPSPMHGGGGWVGGISRSRAKRVPGGHLCAKGQQRQEGVGMGSPM